MRNDTRETTFLECEHLRPVVKLDIGWYHIHPQDGRTTSPCLAGKYRTTATVQRGGHSMDRLVDSADSPDITKEP